MKIVFLDSKTIGDDIDLSEYDKLGEVVKYDFSTTEEAAERTRDADVIVLNKVEVNEKSIGQPKAFAISATRLPIFPSPTMPQVIPLIW